MTEQINSVVLDSEGLSGLIAQDRKVVAKMETLWQAGADAVVSAATIVEVIHGGVNISRLDWLLSRIKVESLTEQEARVAAKLLKEANLHGHKYAIDAMVAVVALRLPRPVVMLTSDVDDMAKLCGNAVRLIGV